MTNYTEEQLASLIAELRPTPPGWAQAARELPAARTAIDSLVERAHDDEREREAILADLENALRAAGVEPRRPFLEELLGRLGEDR